MNEANKTYGFSKESKQLEKELTREIQITKHAIACSSLLFVCIDKNKNEQAYSDRDPHLPEKRKESNKHKHNKNNQDTKWKVCGGEGRVKTQTKGIITIKNLINDFNANN